MLLFGATLASIATGGAAKKSEAFQKVKLMLAASVASWGVAIARTMMFWNLSQKQKGSSSTLSSGGRCTKLARPALSPSSQKDRKIVRIEY